MTQHNPAAAATSCFCGLRAPYDDCCGRFHRGDAKAPTAERLMRSRFSAFCVGEEEYLLRTWHPSTRPPHVDFDKALRWLRLEVLQTVGGSFLDTDGTVHFRAHYAERNRAGHLEEDSRFVVQDDTWLYVGPLASQPRAAPLGAHDGEPDAHGHQRLDSRVTAAKVVRLYRDG